MYVLKEKSPQSKTLANTLSVVWKDLELQTHTCAARISAILIIKLQQMEFRSHVCCIS